LALLHGGHVPPVRLLDADRAKYYESSAGVRRYASYAELQDAEPAILERFRADGLADAALLDLGVGGGRTTLHFAQHAGTYVGLDYSRALVEACRGRFAGRWAHVTFVHGDARDLREFADASFRFVLFSWNGLDAVGDADDRARALGEIRRVLAPGGLFAFSAHDLGFVEARLAGRHGLPRRLLARALNPTLRHLDGRDCAMVADERVGARWERHMYVRPRAQLAQLLALGFAGAVALDREGREIPRPEAGAAPHWRYYLATG
jgi:SAM-dependent methyltransferase